MKSILPIAMFVIAASVSSCNKCYECKTSTDTQSYCKDSPQYDVLKAHGTLTDSNGENYTCKLK